ncbi:XerC Integrase [uncultured Caudovirales phage]|uniref:Integrase n=1 Tax=uncultured Caudovirales phage TaxID=2100421 RepID=A0A6J5KWT0_9CAUD|nr:XerC Integrase [uncultured Caudovirales phage]
MEFATYFKTWTDDRCAYGHICESSALKYTRLVAPAMEILGRKQLTQITFEDIDSCYRKLVRTVGPARVRGISVQLHKSLKDAAARKLIPADPSASVEAPRAKRTVKTTTLSREELGRVLAATKEWGGIGRVVRFIVATGCRRGEALGLQWQDVSLTHGRVEIKRQIAMVGAIPRVSPVKTDNANRTITLPASLAEELRLRQGAPTDWVFPNQHGRCRNPNDLTREIRAKFDTLALDFSLHDLRHAHATFLLQQSQPIKAVSQRLGHANVQITLGIYTHVMPGDDARLAGAIDALL